MNLNFAILAFVWLIASVGAQFEGNQLVDIRTCNQTENPTLIWNRLLITSQNNKTLDIGRNVSILYNATLTSPLKAEDPKAMAFLQVRYNSVTVIQEWMDFCDLLNEATKRNLFVNQSCPISNGTFSGRLDTVIPDSFLPGNYDLLIRVNESEVVETTCLQMKFKLRRAR